MKKVLIIIVVFALVFLLGPRVEKPGVDWEVPGSATQVDLQLLQQEIISSEKNTDYIKPDNESRFIFADSLPQKTEYCLLYLHGFSASPREGYPLNQDFPQRYGMNAYIPRLYAHGLETGQNLVDMTPDLLIESAKEAFKIARQLGDKVILMSSSTGGTLSLILAAENTDIAGIILYSPNIEMVETTTKILTFPWGLQMGKLLGGTLIEYPDDPPLEQKYWQSSYRIEAVAYLQSLIENTMTYRTFEKVEQPLFLGYYYLDEEHQDPTVKVSAMLDMYKHIASPEAVKRKVAFERVGVHPLASDIKSKDIEAVKLETYKFAEEILKLKPIIK